MHAVGNVLEYWVRYSNAQLSMSLIRQLLVMGLVLSQQSLSQPSMGLVFTQPST